MARESESPGSYPLAAEGVGPSIGFYCEQIAQCLDKIPTMTGQRITCRISTVEDMPVHCDVLTGAVRVRCEMLGRHFHLELRDEGSYILVKAILLEDGEPRDASASEEKVIAIALRVSMDAREFCDGDFAVAMEIPLPPVRMTGEFAKRVCQHLEKTNTLPYKSYKLVSRDDMLMVRCD